MYYDLYADSLNMGMIDHLEFMEEELSNKTISVESYIDQASTITHTFKLNKDTNKYYFVKSIIS